MPRGKRCVTIARSARFQRSGIFSRPLVFGRGRDNATRFDRVRFYVVLYRTVTPTVCTEKSIARFRDAIFSNASSSFARSLLSVTGHSYAIIFRGCSARPVNGLSPMEGRASFHSRRSREEEERVARDPRLRNLLHRRDLRSSELFTGTTDERILAS